MLLITRVQTASTQSQVMMGFGRWARSTDEIIASDIKPHGKHIRMRIDISCASLLCMSGAPMYLVSICE